MTHLEPQIGIIGLGVMGQNIARNFHSRGHRVVVYNRNWDHTQVFMAERRRAAGADRWSARPDLPGLVAALAPPRRILLMITAGPPVDQVLDALAPLLEAGDVVIDGGNAHWEDTDRRSKRATSTDWDFVGMGVSGGAEGARLGPSMMPGGSPDAWQRIRPLLEPAAAVSDSGPCVTWCGHGSAGHFVKMVHNGIEYGDMQLIAETWTLLSRGLGLSPAAQQQTFSRWNQGPLQGFLIEITAGIVAARDPLGTGPLVDQILDVAGQKGTGRWTAIAAIEAGVPLPTITAAVDARALSAHQAERAEASARFGGQPGPVSGITVDDLEHALYAAKLMSYSQGFALLRVASQDRGYTTDIAQIARIWKAGCIIRAGFLDRVYAAFRARPGLPLLFLDPSFARELAPKLPAWRRVVAAATLAGIPVPALSASLAAFDTLRTTQGSAALIQAQRDWFGAHTFRRRTQPEAPEHADWPALDPIRD